MNTGRRESLASARPGRGGISALGLGVGLAFQADRLSLISSGLAPLLKATAVQPSHSSELPFVFQQVVEHQGAETESVGPSHSPPRSQLSKGN